MATQDFREWRLPQLLAMVPRDPHARAAEQLGSWQRQVDLLKDHSDRLKRLRADLEAVWPPERSDAAVAFIFAVSDMIQAMDRTVIASGEIRIALNEIANALTQARDQLDQLHAQYTNKQEALRAFNQRAMPWLPDRVAEAAPVIPGTEQLAVTAYQRHLDEQAREVMRAADRRVTEASTKIKKADLPDYVRLHGPGSSGSSGSSGEPESARMRQAHSGFAGSTVGVPAPRFEPPVLPTSDGPPVLAGEAGRGLTSPVNNRVGPDPSPVGGVMPGTGTWLWRTSGGDPVMRPGGVIGNQPEPQRRETRRTGGVIGGESQEHGAARPTGMFGGMAPATAAAPRARPPHSSVDGRVLGERRDGPTPPVTDGGWRDTQYEDYARRRRRANEMDPHDPWAVEEGVPPVLDAPDEPEFIAGPGVIGLDR